MNWYVLFTRTGSEEKSELLLKKRLNNERYFPFIPRLETLFKKSGNIVKKEIKPLFPGYVFVESDASSLEFIKRIRTIISSSTDIVRYISYADRENIALREVEKQILMNLCNDDYCIEASNGIIEGNKVNIIEGPLRGRESIVRKIDRHKRRAVIELEFMGQVRQVSVGLEVVKKI